MQIPVGLQNFINLGSNISFEGCGLLKVSMQLEFQEVFLLNGLMSHERVLCFMKHCSQ